MWVAKERAAHLSIDVVGKAPATRGLQGPSLRDAVQRLQQGKDGVKGLLGKPQHLRVPVRSPGLKLPRAN